MESGRFSQSPAFLKRAGHNVEETTFYTATAIFDCTFYPAQDNLGGQKSLGPLKMSLEMAKKVIVPQKKIMSRSFLNSGTIIVISCLKVKNCYFFI